MICMDKDERMTDDISDYSFDFEKEVDELRRSLGKRADDILFIEVDVAKPDGEGPPYVSLPHVIAGEHIKAADKELNDIFERIFNDHKINGIIRDDLISEQSKLTVNVYTSSPNRSSGAAIISDYRDFWRNFQKASDLDNCPTLGYVVNIVKDESG